MTNRAWQTNVGTARVTCPLDGCAGRIRLHAAWREWARPLPTGVGGCASGW